MQIAVAFIILEEKTLFQWDNNTPEKMGQFHSADAQASYTVQSSTGVILTI